MVISVMVELVDLHCDWEYLHLKSCFYQGPVLTFLVMSKLQSLQVVCKQGRGKKWLKPLCKQCL